jgi:hypothetical protein
VLRVEPLSVGGGVILANVVVPSHLWACYWRLLFHEHYLDDNPSIMVIIHDSHFLLLYKKVVRCSIKNACWV